MKVIIALGNPEPRYDGTRHNLGFWLIDSFAVTRQISWRNVTKFSAEIAEITNQSGEKLLLAKPTTYYNLSGEAAAKLVNFYKISQSDVLVIHDDLALDLGVVRTRSGGSGGGNNGIKSLNAHLGEDYCRLRVGIAPEARRNEADADYVLSRFSSAEVARLNEVKPHVFNIIDDFTKGTFTPTTER